MGESAVFSVEDRAGRASECDNRLPQTTTVLGRIEPFRVSNDLAGATRVAELMLSTLERQVGRASVGPRSAKGVGGHLRGSHTLRSAFRLDSDPTTGRHLVDVSLRCGVRFVGHCCVSQQLHRRASCEIDGQPPISATPASGKGRLTATPAPPRPARHPRDSAHRSCRSRWRGGSSPSPRTGAPSARCRQSSRRRAPRRGRRSPAP